MDNDIIKFEKELNNTFDSIKKLIINSRNKVYTTVNTEMLNLYWNIGKAIMEIQQGNERARFSKRNLERMRKLYIYFPIATTLSTQLSWSHYLELIKIDEDDKRNFYMKEAINSRWSVRELQRQKDSLLYERLTISSDKDKVYKLSEKGQILKESKDIIKTI